MGVGDVVRVSLLGLVLPIIGASRPADPDLVGRVDRYLAPMVRRHDVSGVVLIGRGDRIVLERTYGMANFELGVPIADTTRFQVGSISKQFTAAAIMLLQQRGRVREEDHLAKFLPGLSAGDRITVAELLTHKSGLVRDFPEINGATTLSSDSARWAWLVHQPLAFEPGTDQRYSNVGYYLLVRIIETASGTSYGEFVWRELLRPAGMTRSDVPDDETGTVGLATGYDPGYGPFQLRPTHAEWWVGHRGEGALYSTARDLFRWSRAMDKGQILPRATIARMDSLGYGWDEQKRAGHRSFEHNGVRNGFAGFVERFPDDSATIIYLSNARTGAFLLCQEALPDILFGMAPPVIPGPPVADHRAVPPDATLLGAYRVSPALTVIVDSASGRLRLAGSDSYSTPLDVTAPDEFFYRALYATLHVIRRTDSTVTGLRWTTMGRSFELPRVTAPQDSGRH